MIIKVFLIFPHINSYNSNKMKIECIKDKLTWGLDKVAKIAGKNLTLPILSCVLFEAKKGLLKIKATNLDFGVEVSIPVKVIEEGILAVPGNVAANFIENINDRTVLLEEKENNLTITTERNKTIIKTHNHSDFPNIPSPTKEFSVKINAKDFINGLASVWYSASTSTIKPELSSVHIYEQNDEMIFVATDSFRLAEKKIKIKKHDSFSPVLIPNKNIQEIIRILGGLEEDLEINISKNQLSINVEGLYLVSRLVDGVFPDYKQIIPKEFKTEITLLKQDLINSLKLAHIFSDNFNQISVHCLPKKNLFELKTKNNDVGENVNQLKAAIKGEDIDINFNYRYLSDAFSSVNSDSIFIGFNGLSRPVVLNGIADKSFTYLVMPMNK